MLLRTIEPEKFASKARNTPFAGRTVKGRVKYTIVQGEAITSMVPSFSPAMIPWTSALVRRGGLTRAMAPWKYTIVQGEVIYQDEV